jgi:hypothetical protein
LIDSCIEILQIIADNVQIDVIERAVQAAARKVFRRRDTCAAW